ncbi:MAG TPA: hypothetical protein VK694_05830 [Verrucomicrobiae bacterium]|nr:hypothetical protein [Verrucomicrobiae bacterium]
MFGAIDYSYLPWEKLLFVGGLVAATAAVALAIITYGFWNPRGRSDVARGNTAWNLNAFAVVVVLVAIIVPAWSRNARVNGQEFRAEAQLLKEHADRNGYDAIYVDAVNDEFTATLNNCRLGGYYVQDGHKFVTYVLERDYRADANRFHFEDDKDLIHYDERCEPTDPPTTSDTES